MKKSIITVAKLLIPIFIFYGCSNFLDNGMEEIKSESTQYGSLTVNGSSARFADVKDISKAKVYVSGSGIDSSTEAQLTVTDVDISGGSNTKPVTISGIPAGKNRIVTVVPYDESGNELTVRTIRAVTDIVPGENTGISVTKNTTSYGNVLYGIKDTYNLEELENDGRLEKIRSVINSEIHPALFDSAKLIGELKGFQIPAQSGSEPYELKTGSVTFSYIIADNFIASVNDPLSEPLKNQKAANGITISGIAPGNWTLSISDSSGKILDSSEIQIKSGENQTIGHLVPDGIVITVRKDISKSDGSTGFSRIHYWALSYPDTVAASDRLSATIWPGTSLGSAISVTDSIDEKDGSSDTNHGTIYVYRFSKASAVSLLVTNADGKKYCETDMTVSRAGVYCVHSSGLQQVTPEESLPDVEFGSLQLTDENFRKCFIDDPENNRFIVLFSENLYGQSVNSVKAEFNKGINDAENGCQYNGTHYTMSKNSGGFWYCAVPYSDVQQTNQSGQPSYNFKVNDSVIAPPSFVPDGYIYQKFTGSSGGNRYLVLIYSEKSPYYTFPESTITANLKAAKTARKLSDFDLTTEEGKQQISNFRLVPGTTKLYRSFHPIKDEKTSISDTSKKRMECLAELSAAAGIRYDINLADTGNQNATYSTPSYYQSIIDSNKVLYMTDCSYSVCYTDSASSTFAGGIKKILNAVASNEGPYQFHCAIGTDRTGICGAVIAGLCGACWKDIEADYYKSINMGIYEYRGPGCVRYSMQNFLGVENISTVTDLQSRIISKLKERSGISDSEISAAITNLGGTLPR